MTRPLARGAGWLNSLCVVAFIAMMTTAAGVAAVPDYVAKFDHDDRAINDGQGYSATLNDDGSLAWNEAYLLNAYVEMYHATRSRRYLDSLVSQFDRVLKNRDDVRGVRDVARRRAMPGWGSSRYSGGKWKVWAVHTGMICQGPADFVRLVRRDSRLRRDYGAKAGEYLARLQECAWAFDTDWRNGPGPEEGYYVDPEVGPLPLNQQNALGIVHLALYQSTGDKKHYYRVRRLAYYFKNRLRAGAGDSYDWAYNPKPDKSGRGSEDISHASVNIEFAVRCSAAQIVFDDRDLRAFGRTWETVRRAPREWADNVNGTGGPNTHMPFAAGGWLNLARWQRAIYEDAKASFASLMDTPVSGSYLLGIARLARWQRHLERGRR